MEETNEFIGQRLKKLHDLKELGIKPYDGRFNPGSCAAEISIRYQDTGREALESLNINTSLWQAELLRCGLLGRPPLPIPRMPQERSRYSSKKIFSMRNLICLKT